MATSFNRVDKSCAVTATLAAGVGGASEQTSSRRGRLSVPQQQGYRSRQGCHLHHPFVTHLVHLGAAERTKTILLSHSSLFSKRWSAIRRSLPALRRRATRRSPAPIDDRPTKSPSVRPSGYRPSPSLAGWKFFPLLYAAAFSCRSS